MEAPENWEVYFVPPCAPGTVVRFLERRARAEALPVPDVFLSDAARASGFRALFALNAVPSLFLRESVPLLSAALPGTITRLYRSGPDYGGQVWEGGIETAQFAGAWRPPARGLWRVVPAPIPPPVLWAQKRGLPIQRVPGLVLGPKRGSSTIPFTDYETVALLDQKNLLVEDAPRLYRFSFPVP